MSSTTGECLCGQIKISIAKEVLDGDGKICLCHCKSCRQATGSIASTNIIVPESTVKITGQPKIYHHSKTDSGKTVQSAFCDNCGSPIYSSTPSLPGAWIVKMGLFDDIPKPSMEVYCKSRLSWNKPIDGAKQFDAMPTQ
ncbi:unnamed protein product [Rotaria sordida]|uniref:CENP-V/GFA domain-containing protein n=1 Tax=Rotaria sordida TaxID=392033 RepID=A0A816BR45_9BILA|nr:unnamed protein product [Rotaria sordida]CAF1614023.1 unnamed protein product [Rotaria sordida]